MCEALNIKQLITDPRFIDNRLRIKNSKALDDELQEAIFLLRSDTQVWMHGKGEWLLSVTNQGSEGNLGNCGGQQVTFQINLTITNWREPRFADGDFNFTTSTVGGGTPIGTYVTLGGAVPLLLIATVVTLGLRKLELDDEEITESE